MFHHISIGVRDVVQAARFYDEVMAALGYRRIMEFLPNAIAYGAEHPLFWIQLPRSGDSEWGNGSHVAFDAPNKDAVNAFHARALALGGRDNGAPGPRPNYGPDYYGTFIIDPDGNHIEAVVARRTSTSASKPAGKKSKKRTAPGVKTSAKSPSDSRHRKSATRRITPHRRGPRR